MGVILCPGFKAAGVTSGLKKKWSKRSWAYLFTGAGNCCRSVY